MHADCAPVVAFYSLVSLLVTKQEIITYVAGNNYVIVVNSVQASITNLRI